MASRSGQVAAGASARRKTPRDSSRMAPSSRRPYSSLGCIPALRASLVVNVLGSDASAPLDKSALIPYAPGYYYIQVAIPACVLQHLSTQSQLARHGHSDRNGRTPAARAKRYPGSVGNAAVQEAFAGKQFMKHAGSRG